MTAATNTFRETTGYKVMVVDDEVKLCEILVSSLKRKYSAAGCHNAEQALEVLAAQPHDVVVTDLKLPGKTGLEILDFVKRSDQRVEAIIVTGYASLDSPAGYPRPPWRRGVRGDPA